MRSAYAAILLFVAGDALACSCATSPLHSERKAAALVFVGRVTAIEEPRTNEWQTAISFEVLQAWKRNAPRTLTVRSAIGAGSCGYGVALGMVYLIFAHDRGRELWEISMCSHNAPLVCAGETLRQLGRPAVRYAPLPSLDRAGSDEEPLEEPFPCTTRPELPRGAGSPLPQGVEFAKFSALILSDGTVRDLKFELRCAAWTGLPCAITPGLEARVREAIESSKYLPATLDGNPVAMRLAYDLTR